MISVYSDDAAKVSKSRQETGEKTFASDRVIEKKDYKCLFFSLLTINCESQYRTSRVEKTCQQALAASDKINFWAHLQLKTTH